VELGEAEFGPEQHKLIQDVLREECHSFSKHDENVGEDPDLTLNIELIGSEPVQRTYSSVPPPLLRAVKDYIIDLVNRGWIQKSSSPYSSPMVCVRKKDMRLHKNAKEV